MKTQEAIEIVESLSPIQKRAVGQLMDDCLIVGQERPHVQIRNIGEKNKIAEAEFEYFNDVAERLRIDNL